MATISAQQFLKGGKTQLVQPISQAPSQGQSKGGSISNAFNSGVSQMKEGYQAAVNAKDPLSLVENSVKMTAGAVNTALSPLAPVTAPIGKAVDYAADKISDISAVQKFAGSKAGQVTSRVAEDVGNLDTLAGAVVGGAEAPRVGNLAANTISKGVDVASETAGKVASKVSDTLGGVVNPEKIMQRVARIPKGSQATFEKTAGESVGKYLAKRNIFGDPESISKQLYDRFTASKNTADEAIAKLPGTYKSKPVETALNELLSRETRVSSPGALSPDFQRVRELTNKYKTSGLDMKEINETKRLYERNIRLDFVKQNLPEGVARSTNVDNALRQWQFGQAEKLGLKNLPTINKETRLAKTLLDAIGKETAGSAGNNAINLTDWVLLAGGDPTALSGYFVKKALSSKTLQSSVAKKLYKGEKVGASQAEFGSPKLGLEEFMRK